MKRVRMNNFHLQAMMTEWRKRPKSYLSSLLVILPIFEDFGNFTTLHIARP